MNEKKKTGAWVRLIISSVILLALVTVLIIGMARGGSGFAFLSIGGSHYSNADQYKAGDTSITTDQLKGIEINWISGSIQIDTYDGDTIEICETTSQHLPEADQVHSYLDNEGTLRIQYRKSEFFSLHTIGSKKLEIKIPVTLAGSLNDFSLDSVSADCQISGLSIKDCDIENVSGSITVNSDVSTFDLDTVSGDCQVATHTVPEDVNTDSVSGDFTLLVPANASFTAEQDSVSGGINCSFATSSQDDRILCGEGGNDWNFDSVSGDVYIDKLTEAK